MTTQGMRDQVRDKQRAYRYLLRSALTKAVPEDVLVEIPKPLREALGKYETRKLQNRLMRRLKAEGRFTLETMLGDLKGWEIAALEVIQSELQDAQVLVRERVAKAKASRKFSVRKPAKQFDRLVKGRKTDPTRAGGRRGLKVDHTYTDQEVEEQTGMAPRG